MNSEMAYWGIEPRPHWWRTSTLITAQSLLLLTNNREHETTPLYHDVISEFTFGQVTGVTLKRTTIKAR